MLLPVYLVTDHVEFEAFDGVLVEDYHGRVFAGLELRGIILASVAHAYSEAITPM